LIDAGEAAVAIAVLRKAVNRMTSALMYLDSSSGMLGTDLAYLMELYARACRAAPPPPAPPETDTQTEGSRAGGSASGVEYRQVKDVSPGSVCPRAVVDDRPGSARRWPPRQARSFSYATGLVR
jgi:hypothetical protein